MIQILVYNDNSSQLDFVFCYFYVNLQIRHSLQISPFFLVTNKWYVMLCYIDNLPAQDRWIPPHLCYNPAKLASMDRFLTWRIWLGVFCLLSQLKEKRIYSWISGNRCHEILMFVCLQNYAKTGVMRFLCLFASKNKVWGQKWRGNGIGSGQVTAPNALPLHFCHPWTS